MYFKQLFLSNFGKFQSQTFDFKPGLNLIVGNNESGKTTLFQALFGILFGFKSERERYLPWKNPHHYKATLKLEEAAQEMTLTRDFLQDYVVWADAQTTFEGKISPLGRSSERDLYLQKIQSLFGFSDAEIFKNSLFLEQRALHIPPTPSTSIQIKQLVSHIAEFKYDEMIRQLEEKYFDLTKKNPQGMDKRNDRILERLQEEIQEIKRRIQRAHEGGLSLKKISQKMADYKSSLQQKKQIVENLQKSLEAERQCVILEDQEKKIRVVLSEHEKKKALIERLSNEQSLIQKTKPILNRFTIGLCFASYLLIWGVFIKFWINFAWILFPMVIPTFILINLYSNFKKEYTAYKLQLIKTESQLEVLPSEEDLKGRIAIQQEELLKISKLKAQYQKDILNEEHPHQVLEYHLKEITRLEELIAAEKQHYIYLSKGMDSPFTLEEDLFDLQEKERQLKIKAKALWTAKETLARLVIEYRKEHLKLFAADTQEIFKTVTPAEYETIQFDEDSLLPALKWNELDIPFGSLSCGTQDQFYFAMKFALLKILGSGRKLPVFLDDPFVNFDYERRQKCLKLLEHYASDHQLFLFTYDPWYTTAGMNAHVISL
ncbi:MAG: AAA family ATPase [Deltaproteobacteria bacterium]|nr:AAA family ATPase [Deltaproteobacteria bacterium]